MAIPRRARLHTGTEAARLMSLLAAGVQRVAHPRRHGSGVIALSAGAACSGGGAGGRGRLALVYGTLGETRTREQRVKAARGAAPTVCCR